MYQLRFPHPHQITTIKVLDLALASGNGHYIHTVAAMIHPNGHFCPSGNGRCMYVSHGDSRWTAGKRRILGGELG